MGLLGISTFAIVALLGIWASLGRKPWMLRFLIAGSLLLTPLLIPVYELVIQHALAVSLIVIGIKLYQGNKLWVQRYSLRTLLFGTTVLGIVGTVLVKAPPFELNQWLDFFGTAMAIASITLVCLWGIFSVKSWRLKIRIIFYSLFFLAVGDHVIFALSYDYQSFGFGLDWSKWTSYFLSTEWIEWWLECRFLVGIVASVLLTSFLLLAKWSRWFVADGTARKSERSIAVLASRTAFLCLLVAVMALPSYVFYRLMTPTPIPVVQLPKPNGYDDLIAAGKMLPDDIGDTVVNIDILSDSQLKEEVEKLSEAFSRIELGLTRKCVVPNPYHAYGEDYESDANSIFNVYFALNLHLRWSLRNRTSHEHVEDILRLAQFAHAVDRGRGTENMLGGMFYVVFSQRQLGKLTPADCRLMAQELFKLDMAREPRSVRVARQLIIDQHTDWTKHIQQILYPAWAEEKQYELGYWDLYGPTERRLRIVELAVNAYLGEMGHLPKSVDDLVPRYLPRIPDDPLGTGPIKYLVKNGKYKIYSNGWDRDDDRGAPEDLTSTSGGDMVVEGPLQPSLGQRFSESLNSAWNDFNQFVRYLDSFLN